MSEGAPLVDTHIHIDVLDGWKAGDPLAAASAGAIVPGITPTETARSIARLGSDPRLAFGAALHPWYALEGADNEWSALEALAADDRVGWIGETGIDHYKHESGAARERVEDAFRRHLELAHAVNKPVIVHCVRAHADCLRILRDMPPTRGIIHAFGGSVEQLREYRKLGYVAGIGCAVTRERSRRVRRVAAEASEGDFVLETDAPFMSTGERGRDAGRPRDLQAVAQTIAEVRGAAVEQIHAAAESALRTLR